MAQSIKKKMMMESDIPGFVDEIIETGCGICSSSCWNSRASRSWPFRSIRSKKPRIGCSPPKFQACRPAAAGTKTRLR